jgi:hypothetical protein
LSPHRPQGQEEICWNKSGECIIERLPECIIGFQKVFHFSFQRRVSYIWPTNYLIFLNRLLGKNQEPGSNSAHGQTNENGTANGVPIPFTGPVR